MSKNKKDKATGMLKDGKVSSNYSGLRDFVEEHFEREEEILKNFMYEDDLPAANVWVRHQNRNTDKPQIDKPSY